jgi:hypothetical protein
VPADFEQGAISVPHARLHDALMPPAATIARQVLSRSDQTPDGAQGFSNMIAQSWRV